MTSSFKSLMMALISAKQSVLLLIHQFCRYREFQWLPFGLSHHKSPHPLVRESMRCYCQLLSKCSNDAFQNWENNKMGSGIHWTHCETDLSQNLIYHLTSINSYSDRWTTVMFWIPQNQSQFRAAVQQSLKGLIISFPPAQCCPGRRLYVPLGEDRSKTNSLNFWLYTGILSQGDLAYSSFKVLWVCKLA